MNTFIEFCVIYQQPHCSW